MRSTRVVVEGGMCEAFSSKRFFNAGTSIGRPGRSRRRRSRASKGQHSGRTAEAEEADFMGAPERAPERAPIQKRAACRDIIVL